MKKKTIAAILALCAVSLIVGCSSDNKNNEKTTTAAPVETSAQVTATEDTSEKASDTAEATGTQTPTASDTAEATGTQEAVATENGNSVIDADGVSIYFNNGMVIPLGAKADRVILALGDPTDQFESPSCLHPGNDVVYYYEGFSVTTQPNADGDNIVTSIELTSDEVKLANGISANSDVDETKAAFGDDFTEAFGRITYTYEKITLDIVCDGDIVTALAFSYNAA